MSSLNPEPATASGRLDSAPTRDWRRRSLYDLACVAAIAIVAAGVGQLRNRLSSDPLPLVYQTPAQRLEAELTSLVTAPPFKLPPAQTVGLAEFRAAVDHGGTVIIDARPSFYFERGHVPGAINLARDDFARDYRKLAPMLKAKRDEPIIVYCTGGACHDSRLVANALISLGYAPVSVFTGGWEAWSQAGLPVVTGQGNGK
jgi:rhodanese-related sulfurtransferase